MDLRDIKELIKLLDESTISKLELEDTNGFKLKLEKSDSVPKTTPGNLVRGAESVIVEDRLTEKALETDLMEELMTVYAPMVGTFFRAPAPDAEPFVKEGVVVEIGDTLCIIEAMKLMNEITAEFRGRVVKILVENGQPVEYNQPLFLLERI